MIKKKNKKDKYNGGVISDDLYTYCKLHGTTENAFHFISGPIFFFSATFTATIVLPACLSLPRPIYAQKKKRKTL